MSEDLTPHIANTAMLVIYGIFDRARANDDAATAIDRRLPRMLKIYRGSLRVLEELVRRPPEVDAEAILEVDARYAEAILELAGWAAICERAGLELEPWIERPATIPVPVHGGPLAATWREIQTQDAATIGEACGWLLRAYDHDGIDPCTRDDVREICRRLEAIVREEGP